MVVVFDENDEQLPEYQGVYEDVIDRIKKDKPDSVEIQYQ